MTKVTSKTLAILGGMGWPSTLTYYQRINERVNEFHGKQHSAEILLYSIDFQRIIDVQVQGAWTLAGDYLGQALINLKLAGAQAFLIASNTMHLVYDQIRSAVDLPGLSIIDATATEIRRTRLKHVAFLGTKYTMEHPYFQNAYAQHGVELLVPDAADRKRVNEIIFRELIKGVVTPESQQAYLDVIDRLRAKGAEGIVFGCTEIGLLLDGLQLGLPSFDTALLHADFAAKWCVS